MVKIDSALLEPCPFCNGAVELWKYRELIKCQFTCKKCKVKFEFPQGYDSKICTTRWNDRVRSINICKKTPCNFSETIVMDAGIDQFKTVYYTPVCRHGYDDCVFDPAYINATYPQWYKRLYGDSKPTDVFCENCTNGERYDDEDK